MTNMTQATISIEPLTPDHLAQAHQLSQAAGWPHRQVDWANLLAVSSGVAALQDGRVVGTGICSMFDGRARLNMIIVAQSARSRGLGRRILDALVALGGDLPMSLTATEDGFPLYRKLGFEPANIVSQYQGIVTAPAILPDDVRAALPGDMPAILAMDTDASDAGRGALLQSLADRGQMMITDGGFACLVPFGRGMVLGPVVADSAATARRLLAWGLRDCDGRFVRIDTAPDLGLVTDLEAFGLSPVGDGKVMHRGAPPSPGRFRAYALASQAVG